jgi:hypothetical protein
MLRLSSCAKGRTKWGSGTRKKNIYQDYQKLFSVVKGGQPPGPTRGLLLYFISLHTGARRSCVCRDIFSQAVTFRAGGCGEKGLTDGFRYAVAGSAPETVLRARRDDQVTGGHEYRLSLFFVRRAAPRPSVERRPADRGRFPTSLCVRRAGFSRSHRRDVQKAVPCGTQSEPSGGRSLSVGRE